MFNPGYRRLSLASVELFEPLLGLETANSKCRGSVERAWILADEASWSGCCISMAMRVTCCGGADAAMFQLQIPGMMADGRVLQGFECRSMCFAEDS